MTDRLTAFLRMDIKKKVFWITKKNFDENRDGFVVYIYYISLLLPEKNELLAKYCIHLIYSPLKCLLHVLLLPISTIHNKLSSYLSLCFDIKLSNRNDISFIHFTSHSLSLSHSLYLPLMYNYNTNNKKKTHSTHQSLSLSLSPLYLFFLHNILYFNYFCFVI